MNLDKIDKNIISFGENLKAHRINKNISLRKLETLSNIDFSQIHRIEKGIANPTLKTILSLSLALQLKPTILFELETIDFLENT
jgi:transcriptional regulator with XRE-family HTH domain